MVLAVLYEHLGHPLTILTALSLAGFGALLVLLLANDELNIFSFVGIILLVELVKKNGIMMIDFALARQREGLSAEDAIAEVSLARLRPIMMTTFAAIFATFPIAIGFGAGVPASHDRTPANTIDIVNRFDPDFPLDRIIYEL